MKKYFWLERNNIFLWHKARSFAKMWDFFHKFIDESENLDSSITEPSVGIERSWASQKIFACRHLFMLCLSLVLSFSPPNPFPSFCFSSLPPFSSPFPSSSLLFLAFLPFLLSFTLPYLPPSLLSVPVFLCLLPFFLFLSFLFFASSACHSPLSRHFQPHVWVSSPQFTHLFPDFFSSPPVHSLVLAKSPCQFFTMPENWVNAFFRFLIQ